MNTSEKGISFIKSFEKLKLFPYRDQNEKWTIGWGHLITKSEDFHGGISAKQADNLFTSDLSIKAEHPVLIAVHVSISQNEFDALVSLCYNIGSGNFLSSTLVKLLNAGATVDRIAAEFGRWDKEKHADGTVATSTGLFERRGAEADIFLNANYVNHK